MGDVSGVLAWVVWAGCLLEWCGQGACVGGVLMCVVSLG